MEYPKIEDIALFSNGEIWELGVNVKGKDYRSTNIWNINEPNGELTERNILSNKKGFLMAVKALIREEQKSKAL
jgi:hypothetical protein